jgi:hypothetical protein
MNVVCPKCNKEMSVGFVPVYKGRVYWTPDGNKIPWNILRIPKGSVILSDFALSVPKKAEAYYCKDCNLVIHLLKE